MKKNNAKKFRHYEIYETHSHGPVKLLKYSQETKNKRKVCKIDDDSKDYFFVPESALIPKERERRKRKTKRSPVEAQREFHQEMTKQGYKPKTYYLSEQSVDKLENLKKESGIKKWNDFMNELINKIDINIFGK